MKKLALTLALSAVGMGVASAQNVYDLGGGKLIFQGSLTTSGCNVSFDGTNGTGFDNEKIVQMPSGLSELYVAPLKDGTTASFDALPDQAKRSTGVAGGGDLNIGITCPSSIVIDNINAALGAGTETAATATALATVLNTKGVLAFINENNGNEGGFIATTPTAGGTTTGVLRASPSSSTKGVGIAFLRTNAPGAQMRQFVNLDPSEQQVTEPLEWYVTKMVDSRGETPNSVDAVTTNATYDFAYTRIGDEEAFVPGNGQLNHVVSFKFQYDKTL